MGRTFAWLWVVWVGVAACGGDSRRDAGGAGRDGDAAIRDDGGGDASRALDGSIVLADGAIVAGDDAAVRADSGSLGDRDASLADDAGGDVAADGGGTILTGYVPDAVTMGLKLPARVPVLRVVLGGQSIQKDVDIAGSMQLFETHDGTLTDLDTVTPTVSSKIAFQGRGNFTWTLPKKGFAFEIQADNGAAKDAALLGMPPGSDYALYGCYTDKTCMRDALVYALGQQLGRWNPRTRFVELIIDGQYQGLYMIWERVRRSYARVDIPKPAKTAAEGDLTGGYIFRHEGGGKGSEAVDGTSYVRDFSVTSGLVYSYHYPDADKITADQAAYLQTFVQSFEDAMQTTPSDYAKWIDVPSFVDHGIVEELTNNWDGYVHSIYMTKSADADGGKLAMSALWDFDLAFGNGNVSEYNCRTDVPTYLNGRPAPDNVPDYWLALYQDDSFKTAFKCRWQALRKSAITNELFDQQVAAWKAFTAAAFVRDQAKWNTVGMDIFPNCWSKPTYDEELTALHDWIAARITWLDQQTAAYPGTCPETP